MTTQAMQDARELISDKKYDEARRVLRKVNTPKAQAWLAQLDKVHPRKPMGRLNKLLIAVIVIGLIVILIGGGLYVGMLQQDARETIYKMNLDTCTRIMQYPIYSTEWENCMKG